MIKPKYSGLQVIANLRSTDGNIFAIIGEAQDQMRRARVPTEDIDKLRLEVVNCQGDFDDALNVIRRYVQVMVIK